MTQAKQEKSNSSINLAQSVSTGIAAGGAAVLSYHPMWVFKVREQSGLPRTWHIPTLYLGIGPNAANMIPLTALQVLLNQVAQNAFNQYSGATNDYQRITCAVSAGVGSSLLSCPVEFVMTQQTRTKSSFLETFKYNTQQAGLGVVYRGLAATAIREGIFTGFYLGIRPIFKEKIKPHMPSELQSTIVAGIGAGLAATVLTQGIDTLKTIQQAATIDEPASLIQTSKKLYHTSGALGFFKGLAPRSVLVATAVTVMGVVSDKMDDFFENSKSVQIK